MSWITPLGFLGLLGLLVLILIYILKPNYQQKAVSSTYVWKLSLKYKKKRLPVSKLRNILLFICQVLIIVSFGLILAQPVIKAQHGEVFDEKIVILDASANMRTQTDGESRFERAVNGIKELASEVAGKNGHVSVIIADGEPYFLAQRAGAGEITQLTEQLDGLIPAGGDMKCSYGSADMEKAMSLAETVLKENAASDVILYTGTKYTDKGKVIVKDVSVEGEWNAAVLGATADTDADNYYTFTVDVACYGKDTKLILHCDVYGANEDSKGTTETIQMETEVRCFDDKTQTFSFVCNNRADSEGNTFPVVYSYDNVRIYFTEADSFADDNTYYLYGGKLPKIKIQYASSAPNPFVPAMMMALRSQYSKIWDIEYKEIRGSENYATEGYDYYIFEHSKIPKVLPSDGVVLLLDPLSVPSNLGVKFDKIVSGKFGLEAVGTHMLTQYMPLYSYITQYSRITYAEGFETLLTVDGDPALLLRNEPNEKIVLMPISVNWSDTAVTDFTFFLYNMHHYFFPRTFGSYSYKVGDAVQLNARGEDFKVNGPDNVNVTFTEFPASLTLTTPGVYSVTQTILSGEIIDEKFTVNIPAVESVINRTEDTLINPYLENRPEPKDSDLLVWFAAALVTLLFAEWLLHSREG